LSTPEGKRRVGREANTKRSFSEVENIRNIGKFEGKRCAFGRRSDEEE